MANAITMRLADALHAVSGMPVAYEDLDGGSEERGCGDIDLRRGTRLTGRTGRFEGLLVLRIGDDAAGPYVLMPVTRPRHL